MPAQDKKQFTELLAFLGKNQGLWHDISSGGLEDGGTVYMAETLDTLFDAGYYDLAVQAIYTARNEKGTMEALTRMFLALLAEKVEREGIEEVKNMFIAALGQGQAQ